MNIPDSTPYAVFDCQTQSIIRSYTYGQRRAANRYAEKRNQEYGAHRYTDRIPAYAMQALQAARAIDYSI